MHIPHPSNNKYRPDIDGLRALAVCVVLIFHAFPEFLPSGFVGVDIFFVISGFLISGIIFDALKNKSFSFLDFYARRIKRIYPALILVLTVGLMSGWFLLYVDEYKQLGSHVSRAAVFLSNFVLWRESGYFDNAAETKPLLHLWSLGVEEQFYIIWPVFIWAIWRWSAARLHLIILLIISSFGWNVYQSHRDIVHDFYSPLTRFWELLSGALLAYVFSRQNKWGPTKNFLWSSTADIRGFLGLTILIIASILTPVESFPGLWALLPVVGAVLFISADSKSGINYYIFSRPAVVWVGMISYPLYLWHWPILSFARIVEGGQPSFIVRCFSVCLAFILSWLTFLLVEKPIRYYWSFRYKTMLLVLGMLSIGGVGYGIYKAEGYPLRSSLQEQTIINRGDIGHDLFHSYLKTHFHPCVSATIQSKAEVWKDVVRCFQSKAHSRIDLVLLGDSHAEHLFLGVAEALPELNVAFYIQPALPLASIPAFKHIFDHLMDQESVRTVMIAANWEGKLKSNKFSIDLERELDITLQSLRSKNIKAYVIGDVPQFDFSPQRCKLHRPLTENLRCEESVDKYQQSRWTYESALLSATSKNPNSYYVDVGPWLCTTTECSMAKDGLLLYRDNNHLNINGSRYVGLKIIERYRELSEN